MFRGWLDTLATVCAVASVVACSQDVQPRKAASEPASQDADGAVDLQLRPIDTVSFLDLDTVAFAPAGARVGLHSARLFAGNVPVVSFIWPSGADWIEILRCSASTRLTGTFGEDVVDLELSSPSVERLEELSRTNDFWSRLNAQSTLCAPVANHHIPNNDDGAFQDTAAPTGSFRYFVRACVFQERLVDTEYGEPRSCSRMIGISNLLENFTSSVQESQRTLREQGRRSEDKITQLGQLIANETINLNNGILACEERETGRKIRVERKRLVTILLGAGASLGVRVMHPETGIEAVNAGTQTWRGLFDDTWAQRDDIISDGTAIGTALSWLLASSNDYPRSCTEAEQSESLIKTLTAELQAQHQIYAQLMDRIHGEAQGGDLP